MKHSFRKYLSILLTAAMIFGGAASTVFAFNGEDFVPEIYDIDGTDPSEAQREALVLSLSSTSLEIEVDGSGKLKAEASGGNKDQYEFDWFTDDNTVATVSGNGTDATVYGLSVGEATISCQVYDGYEAVSKSCKVKVTKAETPAESLALELSRGTIDVGMGGSAILMASASGGTGMYQYTWTSSNYDVVDINGDDTSVELRAVGAGTATIRCNVYDGEESVSRECVVNVTSGGGSITHNPSGNTTTDKDLALSTIADNIANVFYKEFGQKLSSSAVVKFDNASDWYGRIRMQNGDTVFPGSNYDYSTFYAMMFFEPSQPGTFETGYSITDGEFTISGTIRITIKDSSRSISSVSISKSSISMDTYSTRTLSVSISPNNASYRVEWESNNTSIVTADSSAASVTVRSKGKEGSTKVVAVVTDLSTGETYRKTCSVTVETDGSDSSTPSTKGGNYNPGLSITYGSDYYGTTFSDSIYNEFHNRYGMYLPDSATVKFSSLNTSYGRLIQSSGLKVSEGTSYRFVDFQNMSFEPYKAGTWTGSYTVTYSNKTLSGTMNIYINGSSLSVSLSHSSLSLATYSSQYVYATVTPNSAYKIAWSSDNTGVATVAGNGNTATINTYGKAGTAKIKVTVTDRSGIDTVKTCTVTVTNTGNTSYSPSISTYIGNTTAGTAVYDSLKAQFKGVYGIALPDTATIKFTNTGDSKIAVRKLANGKAVEAKTNYTMAQYKTMYTDPVSAGTFTVPYTLTYNNKTLTGDIIVYINPAPVNVGVALTGTAPYQFNMPLNGISASNNLCGAVNGALNTAKATTWSYIRINSTAGTAGALYLNTGYTPITSSTNITPAMMDSLFFVPAQSGTFVASISACNDKGGVVAMGNLYITVPGGAPVNPNGLKVQPTTQSIKVNGKTVDPEAYNINGMNYFKLRAIAYLLDNTTSQFSIDYDYSTRAISVVTGAPYQELGTEMQKGKDMSSTCVYSTIEVYVNGIAMSLTSYNIGGSTYFQLAELGNVLGFNVGYDAATRTVLINSK